MGSSPKVDASPTVQVPRRLTRARDDRMIAGVAAGLARHLGVDPVIVRLVFVVLAFAGGGGVLAYVIGWIIIPEDDGDGTTDLAVPHDRSGSTRVIGLVLVVLGGVLLADRLLPGVSWRFVGPILLMALGAVLLAGWKAPR